MTTKRLLKAIERLRAAAERRRHAAHGTSEYEKALAAERQLADVVMSLARESAETRVRRTKLDELVKT
jgi:hypothetical protein